VAQAPTTRPNKAEIMTSSQTKWNLTGARWIMIYMGTRLGSIDQRRVFILKAW
jgi:hypothetical protein